MKKTAQLFGLTTLIVVLPSSSSLAEQKASTQSKKVIYDGVVEDYQGFPSVTYKEPFEVKFFSTPAKEKKFRLTSDGGAQWMYHPLGQCAGHIWIPEYKDSSSWAAGTKGTFDIICPNSFVSEGELTAQAGSNEEGILAVWEGVASFSTPPPPTLEDNAKAAKHVAASTFPNLKFKLKVKK